MSSEPLKRRSLMTTAVGFAVLVGAAVAALLLHRPGLPAVAPESTRPAPETRAGVLAHGSQIALADLDFRLPPAPEDALAYDIREPLRNGRTVAGKLRWLWVPDGTRLRYRRDDSGAIAVDVPVGTRLWKDFHLETTAGMGLIERRMLVKLPGSTELNGWLDNGGWRYYTGHFLPASVDGVRGFAVSEQQRLDDPAAKAWVFAPDAWLPNQGKSAATALTFVDAAGAVYPYVFPGKTNCAYCHEGGAGFFANGWPNPVVAFALHPRNLTPASLRALVERGWAEVPDEVMKQALGPADAHPADPATARLNGMLRNNCLSCHNASARAPARDTAFTLVPDRDYDRAELARRLARTALFMGPDGKPIVAPGSPDGSELLLRLRGLQGRRRMPPAEGGVPEPDLELARAAEAWIASLP